MSQSRINVDALRPRYKPWEEPNYYRYADKDGVVREQPYRKASTFPLVNRLREAVARWRRTGYLGASETSRFLLNYWFNSEHPLSDAEGSPVFRYHWAQREAMETLIYLYEVRKCSSLGQLFEAFYSPADKVQELIRSLEETSWPRYAFKVATGVGKTRIMSLAIVWSYFHRKREADSKLPQHFLVIAPNLIVYERLKRDFEGKKIFHEPGVIPPEWRGEFQLEVVLQDAPGGETFSSALYLTNIHRLYPSTTKPKRGRAKQKVAGVPLGELILGPAVVRKSALEPTEAETLQYLQERLARCPSLLVLNDEAHHLHDEDLAWAKALQELHQRSQQNGKEGLILQLDFTATPRHNDGTPFSHVIMEYSLAEAVYAGIVKVPVIGSAGFVGDKSPEALPAHERFRSQLQIGYARYVESLKELEPHGKKPVLFVMTESAQAANEIAAYLDSEEFPELKGRVLNIHTRLKRSLHTVEGQQVIQLDDQYLKPEELAELRRIANELDDPQNPYRCVVSVLMLREGWDVRNVTVIVPLRPYAAKSRILPEQTLGRGLRRMFPSDGDHIETLTVIDHPAFREMYKAELLDGYEPLTFTEESTFPKTKVLIYPDLERKKDRIQELNIAIPVISEAIHWRSTLEPPLTLEEVKEMFSEKLKLEPLRIEGPSPIQSIEYLERHGFTGETIRKLTLHIPDLLLERAYTAIDYYLDLLSQLCNLRHIIDLQEKVGKVLRQFVEEVLFEEQVSLYEGRVDHRMKDADVRQAILSTFVPILRGKHLQQKERVSLGEYRWVSQWKPFSVTAHEKRPVVSAQRTLLNLTPCENQLEKEFVALLEGLPDVAAFVKNAGPDKLLIDYLGPNGEKKLYEPDFLVRDTSHRYYLVELKGQVDIYTPLKARAATSWCEAASAQGEAPWQYVYVPQEVLRKEDTRDFATLVRACEPHLRELENQWLSQVEQLRQAQTGATVSDPIQSLLQTWGISVISPQLEHLVPRVIRLLQKAMHQKEPDLAYPFQPLLGPLDEYAQRILEKYLRPWVPTNPEDQMEFFNPPLHSLRRDLRNHLEGVQKNLEAYFTRGAKMSYRLQNLVTCLEFVEKSRENLSGLWKVVRRVFSGSDFAALYNDLKFVKEFRNKYIAHPEAPLTDPEEAWEALRIWVRCLNQMAWLST